MKTFSRPKNKRQRRHARVRAKLSGTAARPRLSVFKSNNHIYAQLVDDMAKKTLVAARDQELTKAELGAKGKRPEDVGFTKVPHAFLVGQLLAKKALAAKIKLVSFDRGGYNYTGRVKALADGAREGGLEF
jgi:large subunit ribosomal protein L18